MNVELDSLDITNGIKLAALALAVGVVTATGLIGEVFFSGAIAISLTHPHGEDPPPLREIARRLNYGRLIAVDLDLRRDRRPGAPARPRPRHPRLRLARPRRPGGRARGPLARGALRRSLTSSAATSGSSSSCWRRSSSSATRSAAASPRLVHDLFGHTFVATWLAESVSDAVLAPIFAVAAVLLTVELIAGEGRHLAAAARDPGAGMITATFFGDF